MNIFYKPGISAKQLTLDPEESHHCVKVLRFNIGDQIRLIDGTGGYYLAEIIVDNAKACEISIISRQMNYEPLGYKLEIAIAPTKNLDRFEWFLEKVTEIGVSTVTPLICDRSERKNLRMDRMEKIIISAMKQSVKAFKPRLNSLIKLEDWIKNNSAESKLITHCMQGQKVKIWNEKLANSVAVMIGPEGDFTPEELSIAEKYAFIPTSLGDFRLRTETAGIVACTAVSFNLNK
jgi:16S rRNA (uracil1498-N3)-methyltransferase